VEKHRTLGATREVAVSREEDPALRPGLVENFVVLQPANVGGVEPDEPKVPRQPAQHLIREPAGREHLAERKAPAITLASLIPD
jgi:hypothetical protein